MHLSSQGHSGWKDTRVHFFTSGRIRMRYGLESMQDNRAGSTYFTRNFETSNAEFELIVKFDILNFPVLTHTKSVFSLSKTFAFAPRFHPPDGTSTSIGPSPEYHILPHDSRLGACVETQKCAGFQLRVHCSGFSWWFRFFVFEAETIFRGVTEFHLLQLV